MNKTRITLGLMFIAAFVAGVSVGMFLVQERPERFGPNGPGAGPGGFGSGGPGPGGREGNRGSWLTASLSLTQDQEQEMLKIWSGLERSGRGEEFEARKQLQKERDEAIRALMPAEKHAELEKIHETYGQKNTELGDRRRKAFEAAVEKTKAILTAEQRAKYEEILSRRPGPGGPGGPGERGRRGGPIGPIGPVGPETRPAETKPGV